MYDELVKALRDNTHKIDCELCNRDCCWPDSNLHIGKCIIIQAADAIEELVTIVEGYRKRMWTGSAWIPVGEQLPKDFKKVLVFWAEHSEPMIDTAFWREDFKSFDCTHWERAGEKVTHWMPLPAPPEEE